MPRIEKSPAYFLYFMYLPEEPVSWILIPVRISPGSSAVAKVSTKKSSAFTVLFPLEELISNSASSASITAGKSFAGSP